MRRLTVAAAVVSACLPATAFAQTAPTKQECIEAHGHGQELRNAKKLLEAKSTLLVCSDAACPGLVKKECADLLAEVSASIPTLSITVVSRVEAVTDAKVEVDGVPWPELGVAREIEPGPHDVVVKHDKLGRTSRKFTAVEGQKNQSVTIDLRAPANDARPTPERSVAPPVGAIVLFGVTLGGLGIGFGFEGWALSEKDEVEAACAGLREDACFELDSTKNWETKHTVANVSYGVAGAALLGGAIWWIVDATQPAPSGRARAWPIFAVDPTERSAFVGVRVGL